MTTIEEARRYVGTTPLSGFSQSLLLDQVTDPTAVLEIGCGALHAAKVLMLQRPGYYGIDPAEWLRDAAMDDDPLLAKLVEDRGARFSSAENFDGSWAFGRSFGSILAHSVITHVSVEQLNAFMRGVSRSLLSGGQALVSVNIADAMPGALAPIGDEWAYPHPIAIRWAMLMDVAGEWHLNLRHVPRFRTWHMSWCPDETHDWIVLSL